MDMPWDKTFVLRGAEMVADSPEGYAAGVMFSVDRVLDPAEVIHIVTIAGPDGTGEPLAYDRLTVAEWRLNPPRGSTSLAALSGRGDPPAALSRKQRQVVRQWLMKRSPFAWVRASDQVRASLDAPEPMMPLARIAAAASIPLPTLVKAAKTGRLPAVRGPGGRGWQARLSALKIAHFPGKGNRNPRNRRDPDW